MVTNILITGKPGIGKTTIIKGISNALQDAGPAGFYTLEIRERGIRTGFELVSMDGKRRILSYEEIKSQYKVGKYGVDVDGFDSFLDAIPFSGSAIVIIDEIGKMECFSAKFRRLIHRLLDSQQVLIATIAEKGGGIIEEIKKRHDIVINEVTRKNRDHVHEEIVGLVRKRQERDGTER